MRRLPVFVVLDVSESMAGDNLQHMKQLLDSLVRVLQSDPHTLESVSLSVIAFAGVARTLVDLCEVPDFVAPALPIGGGTALGAALQHLMKEIDRQVRPGSPTQKGDWKPLVFIFTDGRPTDSYALAVDRWTSTYTRKAHLIAVGIGPHADLETMKALTPNTLAMSGTSEADFKAMIQWVSASVMAHSRSVGLTTEDVLMKTWPVSAMTVVDESEAYPTAPVDEECVVLVGRCQRTRNPYLMKYDRLRPSSPRFRSLGWRATLNADSPLYELSGCYSLTEQYFDWTGPSAGERPRVQVSQMLGAPGCPQCGNATAFAVCGCGGILCLSGPGTARCPWCRDMIPFEAGEDDISIQRGQG